MAHQEPNPTPMPEFGQPARPRSPILESAIKCTTVVTAFVENWITAVLVDGEIDDWSRETLQTVVQRLNKVDAEFEALRYVGSGR